ncbi:MAG: division/cell wall cluster transcriptional repressor MraZ [Verrucomicrobiota bacterium]
MSIGSNHGLFTGIHRGKQDEKNRVTIPAAWRFDAETTFLAMFHPALGSVVVFPPSMAERIAAAATQVTVSDPVKMDALTLLGANSIQVTCDKAGRITLNEHVVKEARLEHEVIFRGGFTTFHLSSPTPPKADRDSDAALATLRALRELGL